MSSENKRYHVAIMTEVLVPEKRNMIMLVSSNTRCYFLFCILPLLKRN